MAAPRDALKHAILGRMTAASTFATRDDSDDAAESKPEASPSAAPPSGGLASSSLDPWEDLLGDASFETPEAKVAKGDNNMDSFPPTPASPPMVVSGFNTAEKSDTPEKVPEKVPEQPPQEPKEEVFKRKLSPLRPEDQIDTFPESPEPEEPPMKRPASKTVSKKASKEASDSMEASKEAPVEAPEESPKAKPKPAKKVDQPKEDTLPVKGVKRPASAVAKKKPAASVPKKARGVEDANGSSGKEEDEDSKDQRVWCPNAERSYKSKNGEWEARFTH